MKTFYILSNDSVHFCDQKHFQHTSRKFRKLTIENMTQIKLIYHKENCPRNTRRLEIIKGKIIYLLFRIVECVLFSYNHEVLQHSWNI